MNILYAVAWELIPNHEPAKNHNVIERVRKALGPHSLVLVGPFTSAYTYGMWSLWHGGEGRILITHGKLHECCRAALEFIDKHSSAKEKLHEREADIQGTP